MSVLESVGSNQQKSASEDRNTIALMYHVLGKAEGPLADPHYAIQMESFLSHLALCQGAGGGVTSARDWLEGAAGVIFTFDDGHESNYHLAFPTLATVGATADFFVNPAQVGTPGFATWSQLREMSEGGMSIQSHGFDHRYFLTELTTPRLREDLLRARHEIEDHVGQSVTLLAPPGGRNPPRLVQIARECGYTHVLNSRPGRIVSDQSAVFSRLAVTAKVALESIEAWLNGGTALVGLQIRHAILALAKALFGDRYYQQIRQRLLDMAPA